MHSSIRSFTDIKESVLLNYVPSLNIDFGTYSKDKLGIIFVHKLLENTFFAKQNGIDRFFVDWKIFLETKYKDSFTNACKIAVNSFVSFWYIKKTNMVLFASDHANVSIYVSLLVEALEKHKLFESIIVTENNVNPEDADAVNITGDDLKKDNEEVAHELAKTIENKENIKVKRITKKEDELKNTLLTAKPKFAYLKYCDFIDLDSIGSFENESSYSIQKTTISELIETLDSDIKAIDDKELKKLFSDSLEKVKYISDKNISYFIENDKKHFGVYLLNSVFSNIYYDYDDRQRKIVYNYILFSYSDPEVLLKELCTFNYAYRSFENSKNFGGMDFIDLTSVLVSVFKCVEILFCQFVNEEFGHISFAPRSGRRETIFLEDKDLSLGALFKIFDTNEPEIVSFLNKQCEYSRKLENVLYNFINYSRNGYLHKDLMDIEDEFHISLKDSLNAMFLLILLFEDRQ